MQGLTMVTFPLHGTQICSYFGTWLVYPLQLMTPQETIVTLSSTQVSVFLSAGPKPG